MFALHILYFAVDGDKKVLCHLHGAVFATLEQRKFISITFRNGKYRHMQCMSRAYDGGTYQEIISQKISFVLFTPNSAYSELTMNCNFWPDLGGSHHCQN